MQYHSRLAEKIYRMADSLKSLKVNDEIKLRIASLEAIAADHERKAIFQDEFYR